MVHFVVVYARSERHVLVLEPHASLDAAMERRFALEKHYPLSRDIEIVTLSAESRDVLEVTHSRFFRSPVLMAEAAAQTVRKPAKVRPSFFRQAWDQVAAAS
jgi:hypothetical protein